MKTFFKTAGRVLLIAAGAFFLVGCLVGGLYAIPKAARTLETAVTLAEPVALPENEGRLVVLQGELSMLEPVRCPELGIVFDSPVVNRHSESFRHRRHGKSWRNVNTIPLTGRAIVGDFEIDPALLGLLDAKTPLHDFHMPDDVTLYTVVEDGVTYISEDDIRNVKEGLFFASAGHFYRYHYTSLDIAEPVTVTLVGYQQNGRLLLCEDVDNTAAHLGSLDKEDLRSVLLREEWITFAVSALMGAVCLFFGFKGILYLKPNRKRRKTPSQNAK